MDGRRMLRVRIGFACQGCRFAGRHQSRLGELQRSTELSASHAVAGALELPAQDDPNGRGHHGQYRQLSSGRECGS